MCKACKGTKCKRYDLFHFSKLIENADAKGAELDDIIDHKRCSITSWDLLRGLLLDISEELNHPLVWLQPIPKGCYMEKPKDCTNPNHKHRRYERFESKAVNNLLYQRNASAKLCAAIRAEANEKKRCDIPCYESDAEIADEIYAYDCCASKSDKQQLKARLEASPYKAKIVIDRDGKIEHVRYVCPHSQLVEVAFPYYLLGELVGVFLTGTILTKAQQADYLSTCDTMRNNKFLTPEDYADLKGAIPDDLDKENYVDQIIGKIKEKIKTTQKTLRQLIRQDKCDFMRKVQHDVCDQIYTEYKDEKREAFQMDQFHEYYEKRFQGCVSRAIKQLCYKLDIEKMTVFMPISLDINPEEEHCNRKTSLYPTTIYAKKKKGAQVWPLRFSTDTLTLIDRALTQETAAELCQVLEDNRKPDKPGTHEKQDYISILQKESRLWVWPHRNQGDEYRVCIVCEESHFNSTWPRGTDGQIDTVLKRELETTLVDMCDFIRMVGSELQAKYHAQRMTCFTRSMRHEIGQLSSGTQILLSDFNEKFSKECETRRIISKSFHTAATKFSKHMESYANNVWVRLGGSRYWNGIPDPVKVLFYPYAEFLYKWQVIFRAQCDEAGYNLDIPGYVKSTDMSRPRMYADPVMIEQVAYNLMSNAVKYSLPNTQISLDCKLNEAKTHYELSVTNYAVPLHESDANGIYDFGKRGYLTRDRTGEGVGLFYSRDIAKKHGGTLTHTCEPLSQYNIPLIEYYQAYKDLPAKYREKGLMEALEKEQRELPQRLKQYGLTISDIVGSWGSGAVAMRHYALYHYVRLSTARITFTLSIPSDKNNR